MRPWLTRFIPSLSRPHSFRSTRQRPARVGRHRQVEQLEDRTLLSAIYVDAAADGSSADGSAEFAFPTIQEGLDLATSGDQVEVAAGRYTENIAMKTGVTVIGAGADVTTLVGRPHPDGVVLFDDVELAGFSGFTIQTDDPSHTRSRGVVFSGTSTSTAVLERNVITEAMYGVFVGSPARPSIVNNTLDGRDDRQGIYIGNKATDPTIVNNVIVGYREAGIHVVAGTATPVPTIESNDVFGNRKNYLGYPDLTGSRGNVSVNPQFNSPSAGDFSLSSSSPLIDIGHPSHGVDPDGTRRDLGALPTDQVTTQSTTWTFEIDESFEVPFELFNVTTAGPVEIEVSWQGDTTDLNAALTGRRRPALADPTESYAQASGTSPLSLAYDVTTDDLARGPGWRIAVDDGGDPAHSAIGTITVTVPFNDNTDAGFQAEKISLLSGDLWPSQELQDDFLADLAASPINGQHAIISFSETPDCFEVKDLEHNGIFRQSYLPGRHVMSWVSPELDLEAQEIDGLVNWITPLEPEDKIDPDLLVGNYARFGFIDQDGNHDNYARNADGTLDVVVRFSDGHVDNITAILDSEGVARTPMSDHAWVVTASPAQLVDLASHDDVEWIGAAPAPQFDENSTTRPAVNVDTVQNATIVAATGTITYAGRTGNGIIAGVDDSGVDGTHPDINEVAAISASSAGTHGTHVAGILAGNGSQSAVNGGTAFQWRGMAPNAGIVDSGDLINLGNLSTAINTNSMDLANHSHAVSPDGSYDAQNQTVDQAIQGDATSGGDSVPRRPQVYSAGNNGVNALWINNQVGFFSLTKQMKNAVVVGNWDVPQNDLAASSSMGPTHDGRIKPDVVAPGAWNIFSTGTAGDGVCYAANNTNGYGPCGGTSMASPVVAGITALMLEGWQTTYLDPSGTNIDQAAPAPSTLRALAIQSSTDIVNNNVRTGTLADIDSDSNSTNNGGVADGTGSAAATAGPDYATGWGLVDAGVAVDIVLDARDEHGVPVPNRIIQDNLQHLDVVEYEFAVDADMITAGEDVRVTLAWDDVAAALQNPLAGAALVNDLDLVLVDPNGTAHYPWQLGHTIRDAAGNIIPTANQAPGTQVLVDLPFRDEAGIANAVDNTSITLTTTPSTSNDYVPANAMTGAGAWVATRGRDHINNVEVVDIDNINLTAGHWTLQVAGFDIQDGPQDFSVVGQPHPDLADLVAYSNDKVTIGGLGEDLDLEFTVENVGDDVSESAVQYEIRLSTDFELGGDVILYTSANNAIGVLNPGDTQAVSTTLQITASDVTDLLGASADFEDLIDNDVFLLVRVDSNDTVIAHGDVLENNETNIAFLQMAREADVVLVMDRSGSMGADVTVSNGVHTKLQVLQDSAGLFLDLMRRDAGDRIAEVAFDSDAEIVFGDVSDDLVDYTTANQAAATTAVDGLVADGLTNMTDALLEAYDLLTAGGDNDRQKVLVLFSDGVPTDHSPGLPEDPRDLSTDDGDPADLDSFTDAGIRIYSVGFGTEGEGGVAGIDIDLLEDLSNVGDEGFYHVTGSALDLDKFFVNAVAGAIDSEVIIDPTGTVAAGDEVEATDVPVNSQDSRVTFVLTWHSETTEDVNIAVRAPSGLVIDSSNAASFGNLVSLTEADTYQLLEVHLPLSTGGEDDHVGSWTVVVDNDGARSVDYSVSAITQSTLRMDVDVDEPSGGQDYFVPGDPVPFTVTLTGDDRVPLGYSDVSLLPIVPIANLNSILAGGMISQAQLDAIPTTSNGEPLSDTQRMIMAFEQAHGSIDDLVMELDPIPLAYNHSESTISGQWTGTFDSTDIPGPYTFVVRADGCSDLCEPFSREITRSIYIYEEVDPLLSGIDIEMPGNDTVVVTVTPTNPDGTIYGPSLNSDDLAVGFGDGLSGSGSFTNNLDGSYTVTLEVENGQATGDLEVWVDGTMLTTETVDLNAGLSQIEGQSSTNFGQEAALNVAILGQANGVIGLALKPVDSPAWAAPIHEYSGIDDLWQLSGGIVRIDATASQDGSTVDATIPADLPIGEYSVQLETTAGLGPIDKTITYRVIGRGQNVPERVQVVDNRLESFESGQMDGNSDWRSMGESLVREILALPLGDHLTNTLRFEAANVVLDTIDAFDVRCNTLVNSRPGGAQCVRPELRADEFKPLLRAVNLAHIDARFVEEQAQPTTVGRDIDVPLGNGVSLKLGTVSTAGESQVVVIEGDLDVPQALRSKTHVVYDITTTASFQQSEGVEINLAYEEGDFDSEENVRLFHEEDGEWVDRTTSIDTTNNVVTGLTSSLSPFMMTETPELSINDVSLIEGDTGTTNMVFTATMTEESFVDVDVDFVIAEIGTPVAGSEAATANADFVVTGGVLTIPAGSLSGTISVAINGDTQMEGAETFQVVLSNATAATIVDGTGTGTILDDEHSIAFNHSTGAFELTLDVGGSSSITTVDGRLALHINGNPDPAFPVIAALDVQTILVSGSADADAIDLSDISPANGYTVLDSVTINAGSGNDTIIGSQVNNKINGSGGDDILTGGTGNDTLNGGGGSDFLVGGQGNDILRGQGSGLDTLSGGPGDDVIDGGAGFDHLSESADVSFTVTDSSLSGLGDDTLIEIQLAQLFGGSSANDIDGTAFSGRLFLNGAGGNDTLKGGPGADRIFGGSGRDVIQGGDGNDVLRGQGGNQDSLVGGPGNDKLSGGIGGDILEGGLGDDWLRGESGNDTMSGGAGTDQLYEKGNVDLLLSDSAMTGGLGTNVLSSIETAYFKGGNGANTFDASRFSGNTTLIGSGGDDKIIGGTADDLLVGQSGNDMVSGGLGNDTLQGFRGDDTLVGGLGDDLLDGGTQSDALSGQDGDDVLYGRAGNDSLVGGDGSDVLWGGEDNDVAVGDDGKNATSSSKDDDTVDAGSGIDTVRGGGGGDTIADSVSEIDETFEFLADWVDGV